MASCSSSSHEILCWFAKTIFTSSAAGRALAPASDDVHANAFSLAAKVKTSAVDDRSQGFLCPSGEHFFVFFSFFKFV